MHHIRWSQVYRLGNASFLRHGAMFVVAIPLAARGIAAVSAQNFLADEDLRLPWTMAACYLSALSGLVGWGIYAWRAPELVRRYPNVDSGVGLISSFEATVYLAKYLRDHPDVSSLQDLSQIERGELKRLLETALNETVRIPIDRSLAAVATRIANVGVRGDACDQVLAFLWRRQDISRPASQRACRIFFAVSGLLLVAVIIKNTVDVISLTF